MYIKYSFYDSHSNSFNRDSCTNVSRGEEVIIHIVFFSRTILVL